MAKKRIGNLIVTDGGSIGILTEREILSALHWHKAIPDKILGDIMLRKFTKVSPETPVIEAASQMIATRTRLLVYDRDRLVGIITTSDLARGLVDTTEQNPSLDSVMSKSVSTLESSASVLEAVRVMDKMRIGSVVVTVEGLYDGIFTERDLLTKILTQNVDITRKVGDYCSSYLVTARIGIRAKESAKLMSANSIKRLPITSRGRIVGIVTARDVVESYVATTRSKKTGDCDPIC
jgi:predicted transcriptional regulator